MHYGLAVCPYKRVSADNGTRASTALVPYDYKFLLLFHLIP